MVEQDLKANGRASSDSVEYVFKHLAGFFMNRLPRKWMPRTDCYHAIARRGQAAFP